MNVQLKWAGQVETTLGGMGEESLEEIGKVMGNERERRR